MNNTKDTIYIDVDDEITSIIDKVQNAQEKIVALVLPKRASMLQSSVNMKLLKRAADKSKKNIVLITTEAGLLPLASSVGLFVAKNLQSKPAIPTAVAAKSAVDELVKAEDDSVEEDFDPKAAGNLAIGELATDDLIENKTPAKPELTPLPYKRASDEEESVLLDNSDKAEGDEETAESKDKTKKDKSLKVPNFERFRLLLFIILFAIILLVGGFIWANSVLPKAAVTIATNTSSVSTSLALTLNPAATVLDTNKLVVPAKAQQTPQTASKQVNTTGQKNTGSVASGNVAFQAVVHGGIVNTPSPIPAGYGVSSGGLTFTPKTQVVFSSSPHLNCGPSCATYYSSPANTTIVAQAAGSKYNNPTPAQFTTSYQDSNNTNTVYSASGTTSGGSDTLVSVVSQTDINTATQAITMPPAATIKSTLDSALTAAGFFPIDGTYSAGTPVITQTANVGDPATTVTVTETVTYTMFGVHKTDLITLLDANINQQINNKKQSIQDTGLTQATYTGISSSPTQAQFTMQTTAIVGPLLNIAQLKTQIAGQRKGDVINTIEQNPGVSGVTVKFSPFWVSSTPKNTAKITITVKKGS